MRSRELAFFRLVSELSGMFGWHGLETRLSRDGEPFTPSTVELGRRLGVLGLVEVVPREGFQHGAYAITARGREVLKTIETNGWVLGPAEANELAWHLGAPIEERIRALAPFLEDPSPFEAIVRQLRTCGLSVEHIVWASHIVVRDNRSQVAFPFATDPDPEIRRALFLAWGGPGEGADEEPARFKPPGPAYEWERDSMFVDLLHVGLDDAALAVRDAAARLVYLTRSGALVTNELLANLASPEPSRWSAAALGTARDAASLDVLRRLVAHADERLAGAAVRGLAARADGRAEFLAALRDERRHVRWIAQMGLAEIATDLTAGELAPLQHDPELRTPLAYYDARHR